jgi:DNA-directed RNA polymerase specialized sigma subunit
MLSPERSHPQQRKEQQKPHEYRKDSPELIAQEWESLKLEEVRDILIKEQLDWAFKWAEVQLQKEDSNYHSLSEEEKKKRKEEKIKELVRELQSISDKNTLIQRLRELGLDTTKIINLFGLVYIPDNYTVIAVTDIHGDIDALEAAIGEFETIKGQGKKVAFVCMGDFVDRGEYNFEVVKRLFELKRKYGDEVIILKGDHEDDAYSQEEDGIYTHIDPADFLELLGEAQQIQIPIPGSDRVLIRKKLTVEEKVRELYIDTFSKLPHAVIYRNVLITHAGLPVDVKIEGNQINFEEGGILGRLIAPSKEDLRQIYWSDIDLSRDVKRGRGGSVDLSPKKYSKILQGLGFQYFIRGHQYSYEETSLFGNSYLAYGLFEESIITFHSNQSYYGGGRGYNEGCYLVLNPNGSIVAKGVKEGKEGQGILIVPRREEVSIREASEVQASPAGLTSEETMEGGEQIRSIEEKHPEESQDREPGGQKGPEIQLQPESLEDKMRKHLEGLLRGYEEYIKLLGYDLSGFSKRFIENLLSQNLQELQQEVEIRTRFYMDQHPEAVKEAIETAFVNEVFSEYQNSIETTLRRYLGVLFLNSETLFNNEKAREKVIEFLRKKCSIDDIRMFLNNVGIIVDHIPVEVERRKITFRLEGQKVQINRVWTPTLLIILHEQTKDKKEVEKFLRELIEKIRQNINVLRENYKVKYIDAIKNNSEKLEEIKANLIQRLGREPTKEELNRAIEQEAERLAEETIKQLMEDIEKTLPVLTDLSGEQLESHLRALQGLAEQLGEAKEKAEKEGKKEIDWTPILDNIKLVGGLLASGFLLWIAFLGFFAPLWLIERVKKDVKI